MEPKKNGAKNEIYEKFLVVAFVLIGLLIVGMILVLGQISSLEWEIEAQESMSRSTRKILVSYLEWKEIEPRWHDEGYTFKPKEKSDIKIGWDNGIY